MSNCLSVVIPTTGDLVKLNRILDSICKNILEFEFEIIVVCNPKNEEIDFLAKKHNQLSIQHLKNKGLNAARQHGLEQSKYEWVLFLDDDCELTNPEALLSVYSEITQQTDLFAVGGEYSVLPKVNRWAKLYFYQQMKWLKAGVYDVKNNLSAYLIGGFFILNKKICLQNKIKFDQKMIFGGTEKEFFLQAYQKKLKIRLLSATVQHHSNESFCDYFIKSYKQGRGEKYIESKGLSFSPVYLNLNYSRKSMAFGMAFWMGYYFFDFSILKWFFHITQEGIKVFNEKKISFLNQFKKNL